MDAATIVKRVRALTGITRKELAGLAELSPSTVGRIEKDELDPTWGTLSRILEATGYRISGDTIVSAGDPTAIQAARSVLESALMAAVETPAATTRTAMSSAAALDAWLQRWDRAGWLSDAFAADDMVAVAVSAGNAAKLSRRNVPSRWVVADNGWRALARRLGDAGVDYAVTGLVAARDDRATAVALNPVIYVWDPAGSVVDLGLDEAKPGGGVQLIAAPGDELSEAEVEDGICFVSRAQGLLDAFAGSGRDPDKAEDMLRSILTVSA